MRIKKHPAGIVLMRTLSMLVMPVITVMVVAAMAGRSSAYMRTNALFHSSLPVVFSSTIENGSGSPYSE